MGLAGTCRFWLVLLLAASWLLGLGACARRATDDAGWAVRPDKAPAWAGWARPGALFTPKGDPVDRDGFLALARGVDYVLLGEEHNNPCDHEVQARLIADMAEAGLDPLVGLEMVTSDRQPVLDRFNQGELTEDDLETALDWPRTWGFPFELYRPIFQAARAHNLRVVALNAPRQVVEAVRQSGLQGLSDDLKAQAPSRLIPPLPEQKKLLEEFFQADPEHGGHASHGASLDPERVEGLIRAQSLWDTAMAEQAVKARGESLKPMAIVAGVGHVEHGWGIAHRLPFFDSSARSLIVVPARGDEPIDPKEGELVFYCPTRRPSRLGFTLEMAPTGILVVEVKPDSPAERASFQVGDIIERVGMTRIRSLMDLHTAARRAARDKLPLTVSVRRQGKTQTLAIDVPTPSADPKQPD